MITIEFDDEDNMYISDENGVGRKYQLDTPEDIISAFADYVNNYL